MDSGTESRQFSRPVFIAYCRGCRKHRAHAQVTGHRSRAQMLRAVGSAPAGSLGSSADRRVEACNGQSGDFRHHALALDAASMILDVSNLETKLPLT